MVAEVVKEVSSLCDAVDAEDVADMFANTRGLLDCSMPRWLIRVLTTTWGVWTPIEALQRLDGQVKMNEESNGLNRHSSSYDRQTLQTHLLY